MTSFKSYSLCLFNYLLIFVDSWLRSGPLEQQHKQLCIGKYSQPTVSSVLVFVRKRECTCTNTTTCEEGKQNLRPECSITYLLILASYTYIFFPLFPVKNVYLEREKSQYLQSCWWSKVWTTLTISSHNSQDFPSRIQNCIAMVRCLVLVNFSLFI